MYFCFEDTRLLFPLYLRSLNANLIPDLAPHAIAETQLIWNRFPPEYPSGSLGGSKSSGLGVQRRPGMNTDLQAAAALHLRAPEQLYTWVKLFADC